MKVVLILVSMLFALNSNYAFAKDTYFNCGKGKDWKLSKSFFGSGEMYYDKSGEWKKSSDTKITDDKITIGGWWFGSKNCSPRCNINKVFNLVYEGKYTSQKTYAQNKCAAPDMYGNCKSYSKGDLVNSYSCMVLEK